MSEWKALGSDSYQSIHQDRQRGSRERDLLVSYPVDGLIGITAPLLRRRQDPMSSKIFPPRKDSQERWHTDWTNARFSRLSTLPVITHPANHWNGAKNGRFTRKTSLPPTSFIHPSNENYRSDFDEPASYPKQVKKGPTDERGRMDDARPSMNSRYTSWFGWNDSRGHVRSIGSSPANNRTNE